MSRILIADTPEGALHLESVLKGRECVVVNKMSSALAKLDSEEFALTVVSLQFDGFHMFDLIAEVRNSKRNADTPIISFCPRSNPIALVCRENLEPVTKMLGAWMYLDEQSYSGCENPDAELRRVMERCLTQDSRQELQHQRHDLQKLRAELQNFRLLLQSRQWSPDMEKYLAGLKYSLNYDLELLLEEVLRLHSVVDTQRAKVADSRHLRDRVSQQVTMSENVMTHTEDLQAAEESRQLAEEKLLTNSEDRQKAKEHRPRRVDKVRERKTFDLEVKRYSPMFGPVKINVGASLPGKA